MLTLRRGLFLFVLVGFGRTSKSNKLQFPRFFCALILTFNPFLGAGHLKLHIMKSKTVAYLLWFFLGIFSAHRFYLGKVGTGILYLLTLQLFGIGWIIDLYVLGGMVDNYNNKKEIKKVKKDVKAFSKSLVLRVISTWLFIIAVAAIIASGSLMLCCFLISAVFNFMDFPVQLPMNH